MPRHHPSMTLLLMAAAAAVILWPTAQANNCPLAQNISPCSCVDAAQLLDVSCDRVAPGQLREVMDALARHSVWYLRISDTNLFDFPATLVRGLELRNLIVVRSNISTLSTDAFSGLVLESLDLSGNDLSRVPTRSLSSLKSSLAALNLDFNRIETLEAHAFSDLQSLLWLSLYGNRIRLVDSRAFLGTERSLTRLNLGGNRLGQVPRYALQRLNCLQGLRLHDNNISEILVENLPISLCDLDLSGNDLMRLDAECFSTLSHLSALDLEDNRIELIHEDAFEGIHDSLEWLKLGGNLLPRVPSPALRRLTRVRQLDLRRNRISRLEQQDFQPYGGSLRFIFLQKNSIRTIEEGTLDVLVCAEWLYMHSNAITELKERTFSPIVDKLHVLDMHDNPFGCDCHILWFRDWLLSKGRDVANLPRETKCNATQEPITKLPNGLACSSSSRIDQRTQNTALLLLVMFAVLLSS